MILGLVLACYNNFAKEPKLRIYFGCVTTVKQLHHTHSLERRTTILGMIEIILKLVAVHLLIDDLRVLLEHHLGST